MAQPDFGEAHIKEIEKKTAEAIDAEGYMHTGDKGGAKPGMATFFDLSSARYHDRHWHGKDHRPLQGAERGCAK